MRTAIAQMPGAELPAWQDTLAACTETVAEAATQRAELVVLPECAWPAYDIGSRQAWQAAREAGMPSHHAFLEAMSAAARHRQTAVCAGFVEELAQPGPGPVRLRNTCCLWDTRGRLRGRHAKCFLWDFDNAWFEAGQNLATFTLDDLRLGMMICADARMPEIPATLAQRGAQFIAQPTAWVDVGRPGEFHNPQPEFLIRARALEFGVPIASASKWGSEGRTAFVGRSLICGADGGILVQCGPQESCVRTADVEPCSARVPALDAELRAVLLARDAPAATGADAAELQLIVTRGPGAGAVQHLFDGWDAPGGVLIVAPAPATQFPSAVSAGPNTLLLRAPTADLQQVGRVRIAAIAAQQARSFARCRAAALQGVHLIVVFGSDVEEVCLRARAAENRVFLLNVTATSATVYDPAGSPATVEAVDIPRPAPELDRLGCRLPVARAAEKCVAPGTDMLRNRRPELFDWPA